MNRVSMGQRPDSLGRSVPLGKASAARTSRKIESQVGDGGHDHSKYKTIFHSGNINIKLRLRRRSYEAGAAVSTAGLCHSRGRDNSIHHMLGVIWWYFCSYCHSKAKVFSDDNGLGSLIWLAC